MIDYDKVKNIINSKLVERTEERSYEDLSEILFGEGNCFNESEVRKRMYGMKRLIEIIENDRTLGDVKVKKRILSLSDLHVPFQLPVDTFKDYTDKVDVLQINGDVTDCQAISKFSKTYRVSPMEEIIKTREYLIELIEYIKPKKVVVTYGNHDMRFQSYLSKNLDTDLLELMPKTSLELILVDGFRHYDKRNGTKIEYKPLCEIMKGVEIVYADSWHCQIGDAIFCHPLAFSSGMMKTAEKAMLWFRNEGYNFKTLCMGHTHRVGKYVVGNTTIYEQGCCCDTKLNNYTDGRLSNSQKEGFLYICQDEYGNTLPDKTRQTVLN